MSYKIRYLPTAIADLQEAKRFLQSQYSLNKATEILKETRNRIKSLIDVPRIGRISDFDPNKRQIVISHYWVFYMVDENKNIIEIYRVLDSRRNLERLLENGIDQNDVN
jgi:addiction module RelE/StbE family toxin